MCYIHNLKYEAITSIPLNTIDLSALSHFIFYMIKIGIVNRFIH
jgi:hypothetical protein